MQKHFRILGWLQIILGVIDLLIGLVAFGILSGIGLLSGDIAAMGFLSIIGGFAGLFMLIMAVPNFICGLGLLNNWGGWVMILAVILGLLNFVKFPYGTAIALYTFWIAWRWYHTTDEYVS